MRWKVDRAIRTWKYGTFCCFLVLSTIGTNSLCACGLWGAVVGVVSSNLINTKSKTLNPSNSSKFRV